jgi:CRISPR-associated protein Cmr1
MKKIELNISFNTPAFLGNTDQQGQWRTPPFKTLFRQWWRIVKAKQCNYDYHELLEYEKKLFGYASDKKASRSAIKFKLNNWQKGNFTPEKCINKVFHKETKMKKIDPLHYLGYGPISHKAGESKTGIAPQEQGDAKNLTIIVPDKYLQEITETINLIQWFGTIGGRSRNGWGSIHFSENNSETRQKLLKEISKEQIKTYCLEFNKCLRNEWAHAIGADKKGPLIWLTNEFKSFEETFKFLAQTKIDFRTMFDFQEKTKFHKKPEKRHVISYPITNHSLDQNAFKNSKTARLSNQIRFKVVKNENNQFQGIIYHLPCKAPESFINNFTKNENIKQFRSYELKVWPAIHEFLDNKLPNGRLV